MEHMIFGQQDVLVADLGDLAIHQIQVLVNLRLVLLVDLRKGEGGQVGEQDHRQAVEPGANVGEPPKEDQILVVGGFKRGNEIISNLKTSSSYRWSNFKHTLIESTLSSTSRTLRIRLAKQVP